MFVIRIMGGGLHMPTEENDHRYGLKDYSLTYSGLFILENSIVHDALSLGHEAGGEPASWVFLSLIPISLVPFLRRRKLRP